MVVAAEVLVELVEVEVAPGRQAAQHADVGQHGQVAVHRALREPVPRARASTSGVVTGRPALAMASTIVRRCDV